MGGGAVLPPDAFDGNESDRVIIRSLEVMGKNLYLYLYSRIEIHICTHRISGGYRIYYSICKNYIKIISLISKT
jgi:hypothetical protein